MIKLFFKQFTSANIIVTTITGQTLYQEPINIVIGKQYNTLNTSTWASGIYMISIQTTEGTVYREKFVKNK